MKRIFGQNGRAVDICLVAALALLTGITAVAFVRTAQTAEAANALDSIYRKALYETCEFAEGMAVNLNKLTIANGTGRSALLSDVMRQAQGAQANIAMLPLNAASTAKTMKYINQVGDFCRTMLVRLSSGEELTPEEFSDITKLSESAAALSLGLGALLEKQEPDDIMLELDFSGITGDVFTDSAAEYPTLLYDGPFSDGATGSAFKALEGLRRLSADEAAALLSEFIGAGEVRFEGENNPGVPCYEFAIAAGGHEMTAAVTKQGGRVLYMLSSGEAVEPSLSDAQCFGIAEAFLLSRGYGSMEISYFSRYGGVMTINFAAAQNGVILYPDLIKIQISMEDGAVIGFEAGNYLRNHTPRMIPPPALTEEDIRALINPRLSIESTRLCIIPVGLGERLCYEVSASDADGTYLIYLDAETGAETEIMQVVSDENSTLVM